MDEFTLWKKREKGLIDPFLLSSTAEDFAKEIAKDNKQSERQKKNKRTQLRKFYDEVVHLNMEAGMIGDLVDREEYDKKWNAVLALVNMIVAKAAYARGRDLISDQFLKFIRDAVSEIKTPKDLKLFTTFFEAFMGFYRLYGPTS